MLKTFLSSTLDSSPQTCYNIQVINKRPMEIDRDDLVDLKHLQEDIAEHYCDESLISGELYWECVETLAQIKLMELRGEVVLTD